MYALGMSNVGVAEARKNLASVIERAQREPVVIARRGRAQAVVVSPEHFDAMREALEEIENGMCRIKERRSIWQNSLVYALCQAVRLLLMDKIKEGRK